MADTMRQAYEAAGALRYYFDKTVPIDLWRGLKKSVLRDRVAEVLRQGGKSPSDRDIAVEPLTVGFEIVTPAGRRWRQPDVEVFQQNGQPWIRGCRTTRTGGRHWGISLWDQQPAFAARGGWHSFRLPKGAPIPEALAVTQDDDHTSGPNHYTLAPKDDMPLGLYVQWLKELAASFREWDEGGGK
ncbi:MAG TPA: hypothetical protein VNO55_12370 [Polyangia bacterium]|nr:hypothetical protein [Polyangia bacterium]